MKTLAFFFLLTVPGFCRLGESVEQCEARYGKDSHQKEGEGWYEKAGIGIHANFRNGVAVKISYWKRSTELFSREKLTDLQVKEIISANADGSSWVEHKERAGDNITGKSMKRVDGTAFMRWDYLSGEVRFISAAEKEIELEIKRAEAAKKTAAEAEAVKGF